jgi:hypothetical protein
VIEEEVVMALVVLMLMKEVALAIPLAPMVGASSPILLCPYG